MGKPQSWLCTGRPYPAKTEIGAKLNSPDQLNTAKGNLVKAAKELDAGHVNFIDGIRRIMSLKWSVSQLDHDPDFSTFVAVDSESDHLPGAEQRHLCNQAWLKECDLQAARLEAFWGREVRAACAALVTRFSN